MSPTRVRPSQADAWDRSGPMPARRWATRAHGERKDQMRREWRWLALAVVAIGLLISVLLILLCVPRLGWVGPEQSRQGHCPCCGGTGVLDPWGFVATLAIALLMLSIPLGHIAVLVLAVTWVQRQERAPRRVRLPDHVEEGYGPGDGAGDPGGPAMPDLPEKRGPEE